MVNVICNTKYIIFLYLFLISTICKDMSPIFPSQFYFFCLKKALRILITFQYNSIVFIFPLDFSFPYFLFFCHHHNLFLVFFIHKKQGPNPGNINAFFEIFKHFNVQDLTNIFVKKFVSELKFYGKFKIFSFLKIFFSKIS